MNTATTNRVRDRLSPIWLNFLRDEVLDLDADWEVGARCITLCTKADELLALMDESDERYSVETAVVGQCHVWYFG